MGILGTYLFYKNGAILSEVCYNKYMIVKRCVMKKLFFLLTLLFLLIPIVIKADNVYEITNVELVDKSDTIIEKSSPTFYEGKVFLNVEVKEHDDFIKYKITIKNLKNKQYKMSSDISSMNTDYTTYTLEFLDNSDILEPLQTKMFVINIQSTIPEEITNNVVLSTFVGGYTINRTLSISLNNDEKTSDSSLITDYDTKKVEEPKQEEIKNPNTADNYLKIYVIILVISLVIMTFLKVQRVRRLMMLVVIAYYLAYPFTIMAIEEISLEIESIVKIDLTDKYSIQIYDNPMVEYPYVKGITTQQYIDNYPETDGFNTAPRLRIGCDGFIFHDYELESCIEENGYEYCAEKYPEKEEYSRINFYNQKIKSSKDGYYSYYRCCLAAETEVEVYDRKKKKRKKKKIKDVTYDDLILSWDFDTGCPVWAEPLWIQKPEDVPFYYILSFSDGSKLEVIGDHKIYSVDKEKFVNCITDDEFVIGSKTINKDGDIISLVSKEIVSKHNTAHSIITKSHFNIFANGFITSCKFNNLYDINDMKYCKKKRKTISKDIAKLIPEYLYEGLRIGEISIDFKDSEEETIRYIISKIEELNNKKL